MLSANDRRQETASATKIMSFSTMRDSFFVCYSDWFFLDGYPYFTLGSQYPRTVLFSYVSCRFVKNRRAVGLLEIHGMNIFEGFNDIGGQMVSSGSQAIIQVGIDKTFGAVFGERSKPASLPCCKYYEFGNHAG